MHVIKSLTGDRCSSQNGDTERASATAQPGHAERIVRQGGIRSSEVTS